MVIYLPKTFTTFTSTKIPSTQVLGAWAQRVRLLGLGAEGSGSGSMMIWEFGFFVVFFCRD